VRPIHVASGAFTAGLAIACFARGPIRGTAGDVLIVVFLVALGAALGWGTPLRRLVAVGALAVGLELIQLLDLVGPDAPRALHLILGSTFDPLDLVAYAAGLALAAGLERRWKPGLARVPAGDHNPRLGRPPGENPRS
jgi:hypothetical protein